ncbi:hypothetical protein R1flu_006541 [Riccia fluitans]|uniref:AAA+ ATPase domain-containing protein n=1 Tax=Riccia fluitans TaxID=41844 RepID=A0ABD1Z0D1_9MARC
MGRTSCLPKPIDARVDKPEIWKSSRTDRYRGGILFCSAMALEGPLLGTARAKCRNCGGIAVQVPRISTSLRQNSLQSTFRTLEKFRRASLAKNGLRNGNDCGRFSFKRSSREVDRLWIFRTRAAAGTSPEEPEESEGGEESPGREGWNGDETGEKSVGERWKEITSSFTESIREIWAEVKNFQAELRSGKVEWNPQKMVVAAMYAVIVGIVLRGAYMAVYSRTLGKQKLLKLTDKYMESLIPEPTPANVYKMKRGIWRMEMPEGYTVRKYKLEQNGEYTHDFDYPGENPEEADQEDDDPEYDAQKMIDESFLTAEEKQKLKEDLVAAKKDRRVKKIMDGEVEVERAQIDILDFVDTLTDNPEEAELFRTKILAARQAQEASEKKTEGSAVQKGEATTKSQDVSEEKPKMPWKERLIEWERILKKADLKETLDSFTSKYAIDLSWPQIEASIEMARAEEENETGPGRAFWVARTWWKYRPKLPYTYFLAKVEDLEVESAVYTEDMKTLYVRMKDGFPSEYVVDIPVDPYLYDVLKRCGVKTDVLHRGNLSYYGRVLISLLPSIMIILYVRAWQYDAREKASETIYDLLKMNRDHLILPEEAADKARSQYKDVVVGGDIWQVIDEIMIYMRNPMKYYSRDVKLPRGILISGPPGTGKTLLARAIARESGLPFVFASGAEFVESSTGNGSDKIFDIFFTARANAPSFIFIDEIDALAGKNVNDDAERRATFEQLLAELDGEPEDTDVDRFSLRQAVILICATNRPDELDEQFMRPGRIDREIHIGLPGEKERIAIFGVHSQGKPLADDVDFAKLVFRTIGYSGADIRNLINEAGIMAVRKGHDQITQQDLVDVLDKQLFEGMGVVLMDDELKRVEEKIPTDSKKLLAVHEAGHVLLSHLLPNFDWHAFSHLLPGGNEAALSVFFPREEMLQLGHTTVGYVKMQMVVAHGGRCAERLVFGEDISDGGQDDLARISSMARELTISITNERLGLLPMKWRDTLDAPKLPGEVELVPHEWDKPGTQIANMTVELSELFTREVTKYVEETEEMATEALTKNRHILDKLAEVLFANIKLSGFEAEEIIRSMNPVYLPDLMETKVDLKSWGESEAPPNITGRYKELNIYQAPQYQG